MSKLNTKKEALAEAKGMVGDDYPKGRCQEFTRDRFNAPPVGDVDKDGRSDAEDGWKSEPFRARHTDRNPEPGSPVAWEGGSHDDGHRAIADVDGYIISTDAPVAGKIGRVHLDWVERNWGLHYLGWTDTISGKEIPEEEAPKPPKEPRKGSDAAKALANLRSALRRAKLNGYTERARELENAIDEILNAPKKR